MSYLLTVDNVSFYFMQVFVEPAAGFEVEYGFAFCTMT